MKVSIITIVYNNVQYIESCIQSVLSQTYDNIEHIIIDGGSNDGTQKVIEPYIPQLGCYISEKDNGLYNALNKGINVATGNIIGILHSDDFFYENTTIEKTVNSFASLNADLVYANGMNVERENNENIKRVYKSKPFEKMVFKFWLDSFTHNNLCKKKIFTDYGLL